MVGPVRSATHTLESLLAGVTNDNRHGEVDTGPGHGQELRRWSTQPRLHMAVGLGNRERLVESPGAEAVAQGGPSGDTRPIRARGLCMSSWTARARLSLLLPPPIWYIVNDVAIGAPRWGRPPFTRPRQHHATDGAQNPTTGTDEHEPGAVPGTSARLSAHNQQPCCPMKGHPWPLTGGRTLRS